MRATWVTAAAAAVLIGCSNPSTSNQATPAVRPGAPSDAPPKAEPLWLEDLAAAQAKAKATGKPVLANFTGSDWCTWCVRLEGEVFAKPAFRAWAAESVVLLKVDFPEHAPQSAEQKRKNHALAKRYNVRGFPTVLVLKPDGSVAGELGYVSGGPAAWIAKAEQALK